MQSFYINWWYIIGLLILINVKLVAGFFSRRCNSRKLLRQNASTFDGADRIRKLSMACGTLIVRD